VLSERVVRAEDLDLVGLHGAHLLVRLLQVAVEVRDRRQVRLLIARQRCQPRSNHLVEQKVEPPRHLIATLALAGERTFEVLHPGVQLPVPRAGLRRPKGGERFEAGC
jgi:hypothetical protein